MSTTVAAIYRYPVKGLNGERLDDVTLTPGEGLPHDRRFALAHGASRFDSAAPEWRPKSDFLMLQRHERLALLDGRFDPADETLTVYRDGRQVARGVATDPVGRTIIEQFFAAFMGEEAHGRVHLITQPGIMFTDTSVPLISIINMASVRDLERVVGRPVELERFRGNIYVDGGDAWSEARWVGSEIGLGAARLRVVEAIGRCAATNVNPETAARDMNLPLALQRGFGHADLGVYAEVTTGATVTSGDAVEFLD